jgi:glutamine synthetase type III|tara:strand:- start:785 stop:1129 length:345 start_codon:yes stop_codon:yes gene_type:complete
MIEMVETGVIPACADDFASYAALPALAGSRAQIYGDVATEVAALTAVHNALPTEGDDIVHAQARYCADVIKPAMETLREACDEAELVIAADKYPYPKYREMLFQHHFEDVKSEF